MFDCPAAVDFAVAEVFGHGLAADFGHGMAFGHGGFELEAAQVVGEIKCAAGFEQLHGFADEAGVVALDVEDVEHLFAVGKAGRVHHDEVEAFAFGGGVLQILEDVGTDDAVLLGVDAVELEVAPCPIEIGVGQIDGFAANGAAGGGVYAEAAGVGEEVEEAFAPGFAADEGAGVAVVEEEAGVEVFVEVYPEGAAVFVHDKIFAAAAGFFVLAAAALAAALFEVDVFGGKAGDELHGFHHFGQPGFVFGMLHDPAGVVFLQVDVVAVDVDGEGVLRDVAVVEPPGFDVLPARPFDEVFGVFAQPVGKGGDFAHVRLPEKWKRSAAILRLIAPSLQTGNCGFQVAFSVDRCQSKDFA